MFYDYRIYSSPKVLISSAQKCSITTYAWSMQSNQNPHFYIYSSSSAGDFNRIMMYLPTDVDETLSFTVVAKLETPIIYQLSPQQLSALRGINNIWSDANGDVEVKYWKHANESITRFPYEIYSPSDDYLIVTSDGYTIGEEADYIEY